MRLTVSRRCARLLNGGLAASVALVLGAPQEAPLGPERAAAAAAIIVSCPTQDAPTGGQAIHPDWLPPMLSGNPSVRSDPPAHYAHPSWGIDNFEDADPNDFDYYPPGGYLGRAGSFKNPYDADYPGVETITTDVRGSSPTDFSGRTNGGNTDYFDHYNTCNEPYGDLRLAVANPTTSGDNNLRIPPSNEFRGRMRWYAPVGAPGTNSDVDCVEEVNGPGPMDPVCDVGFYGGFYFYETVTGNNLGAVRIEGNSPTLDDKTSFVFDRHDAGGGTGFSDTPVARGWDIADAANGGGEARVLEGGDLVQHNFHAGYAANQIQKQPGRAGVNTKGVPLRQFNMRVMCNPLEVKQNGVIRDCPGGSGATRTRARMQHVALYITDHEAPKIVWPNSGVISGAGESLLDPSVFHQGHEALEFDVVDNGTGIDSFDFTINSQPVPSGAVSLASGSAVPGNQPCHIYGTDAASAQGLPTTQRTGWQAWTAFAGPGQVGPYSGEDPNAQFAVGPCPKLSIFKTQPNHNLDPRKSGGGQKLKQGANQIAVSVADYSVDFDDDVYQDPSRNWASGFGSVREGDAPGWPEQALKNTDWTKGLINDQANEIQTTRTFYVDSKAPLLNAPSIQSQVGGGAQPESGFARGTVSASASGITDDRSEASDVAGVRNVSVSMRRNNTGTWTQAGSPVQRALPGSQPGTSSYRTWANQSMSITSSGVNTNTAQWCDGDTISFRVVATDAAGNAVESTSSSQIDNTPPTYDGNWPAGPQAEFAVIPHASDVSPAGGGCSQWGGSGVAAINWQLVDEDMSQAQCTGQGRVWNLDGRPGCTLDSYAGPQQGMRMPPVINDDSQVVWVRARDRAGNMSGWTKVDPDIDDGAPQIKVENLREEWQPDAQHYTDHNVTHKLWDAKTGIDKLVLDYKERPANPADPACNFSNCGLGGEANAWVRNRNYPDEGVYRVIARAQDKAGNLSQPVEYAVRVDRTALEYPQALNNDWLGLEDGTISKTTRLTVAARDRRSGIFDYPDDHPSGPYRGHFEICPVGGDCSTPAPSTNDGAGGKAEYGDWEPIHQPHPTRAEPCTANTLENPNGFNLKAENTSAPASGHVTAQFTCRFNPNTYPQGEYFVRFHGWDMAGNPSVSEPVRVELKPRAYCPL